MEEHVCGTVKCPACRLSAQADGHRFLKQVSPKDPKENIIFFDFETDQSSGEHIVNYALAQYADGTEKVFPGYTACQDFCAWLFTPRHKGYTGIAHNMKGYVFTVFMLDFRLFVCFFLSYYMIFQCYRFDGQFVMASVLAQGCAPYVIPNGSMIMSLRHTRLNIRIIDFLNFLPMTLAKLPACFGLSELKKGYFPHLFNIRENQTYVGPLPEPLHYSPDSMAPTARSAFTAWHKEHKGDMFDFQQEMLAYCRYITLLIYLIFLFKLYVLFFLRVFSPLQIGRRYSQSMLYGFSDEIS